MEVLSYVGGIALIALGLIVSVALHELGHLYPAKKFGVRVPQYFVGFGKTLWSKQIGETEYGIKALPLGGFVRLVGMFPPRPEAPARAGILGWMDRRANDAREFSAAEVLPGQQGRAFYALSTPKKLAVMFGGPAVNLILAMGILTTLLLTLGIATASSRVNVVSACMQPATTTQTECTSADAATPAAVAGLEPGDRILAWNGQQVSRWEEVSAAIVAGGTSSVPVTVERGGSQLTLEIAPVLTERPIVQEGRVLTNADGTPQTHQVPFVGISPSTELQRRSPGEVPGVLADALGGTVRVVLTLPQRLVGIAQSVFGTQERDPNVMGLIGIGRVAGTITSTDAPGYGVPERAADLLSILASLNLALFVFNMIPLLPLDGGHVAGALYEGARRRVRAWRGITAPYFADTAKLMPLTYVVVGFMIAMSALLAVADITKPIV